MVGSFYNDDHTLEYFIILFFDNAKVQTWTTMGIYTQLFLNTGRQQGWSGLEDPLSDLAVIFENLRLGGSKIEYKKMCTHIQCGVYTIVQDRPAASSDNFLSSEYQGIYRVILKRKNFGKTLTVNSCLFTAILEICLFLPILGDFGSFLEDLAVNHA